MEKSSQKYWFKAKRYGYGWYPASWQAALIMLVFFFMVGLDAYNLSLAGDYPTTADFVQFFLCLGLSIAFLVWIAYKTGEKPGWRWGRKSE